MSLISLGNVIVDLTLSVPHLPERGTDILATATGSRTGGSFNTLFAATRQGLAASYGGAHGSGVFGELVRTDLAGAGIGILQRPTPELDSGFDIAVTDADGERTFITSFGAEAELTAAQAAAVQPGRADLVHLSGYGLLERTNAAVLTDWVRRVDAAVPVLLDPGPLVADIPAETWRVVLGRADWLTCNDREAELLTGSADPAVAAARLADDARGVIVRCGSAGAILAQDGRLVRVAGFRVDAVDSNGAGDAHTGAFAAALSRGEHPTQAVRVANACAAVATTRRGPATAPTLAQTLDFLSTAETSDGSVLP